MTGNSDSAAYGPRSPAFLRSMHEQLDALVADRNQMSELVRLTVDITSDLELDAVLHRILAAATTLCQARYAALGVWQQDGTLASFLHTGMSPDVVGRIGHLPVGKGILGELRNRSTPLRLPDLSEHPAACGFPAEHPRMRAFLGVPINIHDELYGSLYVTDDREVKKFTETDELTIQALALAASGAISNARLYERVRMAASWTTASREITTALLSGTDAAPLRLIAERAAELTGAEQAIVLVPVEPEPPEFEVQMLTVSAAVGRYAGEVLGQNVPVAGSTSGEVFQSGQPRITTAFRWPIHAFTDVGERPAIVMPLGSDRDSLGVIVLARNESQPPFDASYLDLVRDFAAHAAIALTLATAREYARELGILADRERIARDLHDRVIQRIFTIGLDLHSTVARVRTPEIADRVEASIDQLQEVINDIRMSIFQLKQPVSESNGLAHRLQDVILRYSDRGDVSMTLQTTGALNVVSPQLIDDAEAVVIEALSNAVRHSGGDRVTVTVTITDDLKIEISDNGHGIPAGNSRNSGLDNMIRRANEAGGHCTIAPGPSGGTVVSWMAPLLPS